MKYWKVLFAVFLVFVLWTGCNTTGGHSTASVRIAGLNAVLQLDREHIHEFLPEYDRHLLLKVDGRPVARVQLATDSGGYSRANVFVRSADSIILVQDLMGLYELDVKQEAIRMVDQVCHDPHGATFAGSFDVDAAREWKFIPASKRQRMRMLVSGCGQI